LPSVVVEQTDIYLVRPYIYSENAFFVCGPLRVCDSDTITTFADKVESLEVLQSGMQLGFV